MKFLRKFVLKKFFNLLFFICMGIPPFTPVFAAAEQVMSEEEIRQEIRVLEESYERAMERASARSPQLSFQTEYRPIFEKYLVSTLSRKRFIYGAFKDVDLTKNISIKVGLEIRADGALENIIIVESSGYPKIDQLLKERLYQIGPFPSFFNMEGVQSMETKIILYRYFEFEPMNL